MSLEVTLDHVQGDFRLTCDFAAVGRLTVLFGRSGSGKTTLVKAIAGLVRPASGRIIAQGHVLMDSATGLFVPPHRRRIGYVFQEDRLFPHLDVRQNLAYGAWFARARSPGGQTARVVEMLGIGHLMARRPNSLSGGERQRVAIGRALLAAPRLLLMDEPLAALDEARKGDILPYVERLRDEGEVPIVYVSHSVAEVTRLATQVLVLEAGRVAAFGSPAQVFGGPATAAQEPDEEYGTVLDATVVGHDQAWGLTELKMAGGAVQVPRLAAIPGTPTRVLIRARDVMLSRQAPVGLSALNVLAGTVTQIIAEPGPSAVVWIECGGTLLAARVTHKSLDRLGLVCGDACHAIIKSVSLQ